MWSRHTWKFAALPLRATWNSEIIFKSKSVTWTLIKDNEVGMGVFSTAHKSEVIKIQQATTICIKHEPQSRVIRHYHEYFWFMDSNISWYTISML